MGSQSYCISTPPTATFPQHAPPLITPVLPVQPQRHQMPHIQETTGSFQMPSSPSFNKNIEAFVPTQPKMTTIQEETSRQMECHRDETDSETSISDQEIQDTRSIHSSTSSSRSHTPLHFNPKYTNHAKGNFYISPANVTLLMELCAERFDTDTLDDEKSAFGYYKES